MTLNHDDDDVGPPASLGGMPVPSVRVVGAGHTDVGRQRQHNEDHVLVRDDLGLFVVADGMGGHNGGRVASRLATTSLANFFEATRDGEVVEITDKRELCEGARKFVEAIKKANRDVNEISMSVPKHRGMGSTVVGLAFERRVPGPSVVHVAHVGDSRCYRMRSGRLKQITLDHSLVNEALAFNPKLTQADLAKLPKNIITRALGMKSTVEVDVATLEVEAGDLFLLCSDGLSGLVDDEHLEEAFELSNDLRETCELLVAMANDAGGHDNISAVLVRVERDTTDAPPSRVAPRAVVTIEPPSFEDSEPPPPALSSTPPPLPHSGPSDDAASLGASPCPECGCYVPDDDAFCSECGFQVRDIDA